MKKILVLLLSIISISTTAQPPIQWETDLPGQSSFQTDASIRQTSDGGFIALPIEGFITKFDGSGNIIWTNSNTDYNSVQPTISADNTLGYIALGVDGSSIVFNNIISKLNPSNGVTSTSSSTYWSKYVMDGTNNVSGLAHLTQAHDGYIAYGDAVSIDGGATYQPRIVKFSTAGNIVWKNVITLGDNIKSVQETDNGSGSYSITAVITNTTSSTTTVYLAKYSDPVPPAYTMGTPAYAVLNVSPYTNYSYAFSPTADHGFIVAGSDGNHVIEKINPNLTVAWSRTYGARQPYTWLNAIKQTSDGGYVVTGAWDSPEGADAPFIGKIDATGTFVWIDQLYPSTNIGDGQGLYYAEETTDGGFITIGDKGLITNSFWVVKLGGCSDPAPDIKHTFYKCPGTAFDLATVFKGTGMTYNWPNGSQYVNAGTYTITATNSSTTVTVIIVDKAPPTLTDQTIDKCHAGTVDITESYTDPELNYYWSTPTPTSVTDAGVYTVTAFNKNQFGCSSQAQVTVNYLACRPAPPKTVITDVPLTMSPNPANNTLNITGTDVVKIEIIDVLGNRLINKTIKSKGTTGTNIDVASLLSGTYFVRITYGKNNIDTKKLVILH